MTKASSCSTQGHGQECARAYVKGGKGHERYRATKADTSATMLFQRKSLGTSCCGTLGIPCWCSKRVGRDKEDRAQRTAWRAPSVKSSPGWGPRTPSIIGSSCFECDVARCCVEKKKVEGYQRVSLSALQTVRGASDEVLRWISESLHSS